MELVSPTHNHVVSKVKSPTMQEEKFLIVVHRIPYSAIMWQRKMLANLVN